MSKEAMKLALDVLQDAYYDKPEIRIDKAIKALEEALAKQEQDGNVCARCGGIVFDPVIKQEQGEPVALAEYDAGLLNDYGGGNVGWWWDYIRYELGLAHDHYQEQVADLYTTPQQRTWVGMDDEDEINWEEGDSLMALAEAIEAKLKAKNGFHSTEKNT